MPEQSSQSSKKRPRTDPFDDRGHRLGSSECEQKPPLRDDEFWFKDGTIVLIAGNVAFRVYEGLLARDSSVLRDLFAGLQRVLPNVEMIDGCPVARLSDRSEELRSLLRAILSPWGYYRPDQTVSFSVVASLIRLGHKYRMQHILDNALGRLKGRFSDKLETWFDAWKGTHDSEPSISRPSMTSRPTDAIAAVNLARLTGATSVLPSALYECANLPTQTLLQGIQRDGDDTTTDRLSSEDVERCLDARKYLVYDYFLTTLRAVAPECDEDCEGDSDCSSFFGDRLEFLRTKGHDKTGLCRYDSLTYRNVFDLRGRNIYALCATCEAMMEERHRRERLEIWCRLPGYFGVHVPGWPDIDQSEEPASYSDSDS
ncbi:uncharacterized protein B0H18DRAFT_987417 [Fomitopsis serialis]|uniref:uncharacterized protein n=1 Tax=Fomitopsis serialis TaxID=139415 RepID=UPI002007A9EC|nr:uncharacterized protein B0H18DRAFT_987417 [Neoantrodia serialis]KAH9932285.1 hypothetical protein B0H18DRAFT_987417 [Neoantrodia serialis]